jgi:hypothetical protein
MDAVSNKLEEVGRNPDKLIKALRNGEVQRFTKAKTNELETFLYENGYLSEEQPLDKQDIMVQMQAMISQKNVKPEEVEKMIERVLKA